MNPKIVLIVGDSLRHMHYANIIIENFNVVGLVVQKREIIPPEPKFLSEDDEDLFYCHFFRRTGTEKEYFKARRFLETLDMVRLDVSKETLNDKETCDFVKRLKPDIVLVYGTHLFKDLLKVCPKWTINLHGGLSPWYRGSATLFYPTYFMQPQYSGMTFHLITKKIDGGDIIQQCRPNIDSGDSIHDVGCKAVIVASQVAVWLLQKFKRYGKLDLFPQKSKGKIFYDSDFKPHHLRVIELLKESNFYEEYLNHREQFPNPEIINQL